MDSPAPTPLATPDTARSFLDGLDLPPPPRPTWAAPSMAEGEPVPSIAAPATGSDPAGLGVKANIEQSFLVGSQIVSFNTAVTEERRAAALNSCLLAQLRASKLHPSPSGPTEVLEWHAAYVSTLINIGWVLQSAATMREATDTKGAAVDKVLLEVVGGLLTGGAATAAALAAKVLDAIAKAKKDDPFIALYNLRVIQQNVVDFGAGLGIAANDGFLLSVLGCVIEVKSELEQVLFIKWQSDSADIDARRYDFSVSDAVYGAVQAQVQEKVLPHVRAFIAALDI